jgi:hypothetical protein
MSVKMTGIEKGEIQGQRVCELRNDRLLSGLVKGHEERTTQQSSTTVYKIGGRGPAGGWIFYDKGIYSNGWRYLEAAPAEMEFRAEWGRFGWNVNGTITAIGTGKRNTQVIVEYLQQTDERGRAAQLCDSLVMDGYDDWFLPGKDELNLMYENLKRKDMGDFSDSWYWSSSENSSLNAWFQNFSDGYQGYYFKYDTYSVRAVRAF